MITKHLAMVCSTFYHFWLKDGKRKALKCRANGRCKIWKTRPNDFRLPLKYGLRQCLYLTPENADRWSIYDPDEKPTLAASVGLAPDVPDEILYDALLEGQHAH